MHALGVVLVGILLFTLLSSGDTYEAEVKVRASTLRSIGGITMLERNKYFNIHEGTQWGEEDVKDFVGLGASVGRSFSASNAMSQMTEDPQRPGFVDASSMDAFCEEHPFSSNHWPSGFADLVTGAAPEQYYREHAHGGFVPGSHDAAADFWELYARSSCVPTAATGQARLIVEPMNECSVHAQALGTNFTEMVALHMAIADRLHSSLPSGRALVGGPTSAFPSWQNNNFAYWRATMGLFLDKAARHIDFISCHIYDEQAGIYPDATVDIYRSGSNTAAILDLHEAYSAALTASGAPLPHLISEYGGGFITKGVPYLPIHDWHVLTGVIGKLHELLDRPDRLLKSIPFIIGYGEWFKEQGNASYPFTLWRKEANGVGPWRQTKLRLFYDLYSEVRGQRVLVTSSAANVQVQAFVNSEGDCWLLLNNLMPEEAQLSLDWGDLAGAGAEAALRSVKRLYYDTNEDSPVLHVATSNDAAPPPPQLLLAPNEAAVLHVHSTTSQPAGAVATQFESVHYSSLTLVPITVPDSNYMFPVPLRNAATLADVTRVRVAFGGAKDAAAYPHLPVISVDGQEWHYDAAAALAGHVNVNKQTGEVFLLVDVARPLASLSSSNSTSISISRSNSSEVIVQVGVRFARADSVTVSSVVLVTATMVEHQ